MFKISRRFQVLSAIVTLAAGANLATAQPPTPFGTHECDCYEAAEAQGAADYACYTWFNLQIDPVYCAVVTSCLVWEETNETEVSFYCYDYPGDYCPGVNPTECQ